MIEIVITKERWDHILDIIYSSTNVRWNSYPEEDQLSEYEVCLIMSVLRSNTPFNVVEK